MSELKGCPFCGGEASDASRDAIGCNNSECPAYMIGCSEPEWNTRVETTNKKEV